MMLRSSALVLISLLVLVGLAACGKEEEAAKAPASQVVAKVNGTEITVHQLNYLLSQARDLTPDSPAEAKKKVLDRLIDEEIAKQAAVKEKLDRTPAVLQAMEFAKDQVLARAYMRRLASRLPQPTDEEVKKYYDDHPELFSQRRGYVIEELSITKREGLAKSLEEQIAKKLSMQDLASWLKSQDIEYRARRGVRAAERLPIDMLPKIHAMKNGEIKLLTDEHGDISVVHLAASRDAPLDEKTAAPSIRRFLFTRRAAEAVRNEIKALREQAKVEYMGIFAQDAAGEAARAKANAEAEARAKAEAKRKAEQEARERAEAATKARQAAEAEARKAAEAKERAAARETRKLDQKALEKGVSGLK